MRILILSCNTGEGHNSTARAIMQCAERDGCFCEIKDALEYWPAGTNRFICEGHIFLYKNAPELFGAGYRFFEHISEWSNEYKLFRERNGREPKKNPLLGIATRPSEKLYKDISEGNYDAVISVHVFASLMMTEIRENHGNDIPTYFVATDYTCSPGVNDCDVNAFFIPSEKLIPEFAELGINERKLIPTGIPVREDFYSKLSPDEAKERLGLPKNKRLVLFMCGSMGVGPIKETAELLLSSMPEDSALAVICGRNEKLYSQLSKLSDNERFFPVGFTKEVCSYMDAASLIITKAGGLSSTEAATKRLPMVFIDAIPGLEIHNRDFFFKNGCAEFGQTPEEISMIASRLLSDKERLERMKACLSENFSHRSAEEIYGYVKADR